MGKGNKMTYKEIPVETFGSTPAAMYLARELNKLQDPTLLRNCGKRITATFKQVRELNQAYTVGEISPKTLANTLRLMRLEVTNEPDVDFVNRLRKNVQIGCIKQGIRLATVGRKAERVMVNPQMRSSMKRVNGELCATAYYFTDSTSKKQISAGYLFYPDHDHTVVETVVNRYSADEVETVTPKLLHERSERRCIRLNKPHTEQWIEP